MSPAECRTAGLGDCCTRRRVWSLVAPGGQALRDVPGWLSLSSPLPVSWSPCIVRYPAFHLLPMGAYAGHETGTPYVTWPSPEVGWACQVACSLVGPDGRRAGPHRTAAPHPRGAAGSSGRATATGSWTSAVERSGRGRCHRAACRQRLAVSRATTATPSLGHTRATSSVSLLPHPAENVQPGCERLLWPPVRLCTPVAASRPTA